METGTVVAHNEEEAKKKLRQMHFEEIRLKKLGGLSGLLKSFTADIK
ncbi:MAG: hypothetical protein HY706_04810 [Candidatus Hydrogenedentes bacterium]|nr:hypothetical protein [Candidatus Hydrogenedentota bacterium]